MLEHFIRNNIGNMVRKCLKERFKRNQELFLFPWGYRNESWLKMS